MTSRAVEAFDIEIERLVDRFRAEWDLSYAEAIGALQMAAHRILAEAWASEQQDDDD